MKHKALDIAKYFLGLGAGDTVPISHMKLQKLIYIANGINIAKYSNGTDIAPLIEEEVEAWPYGPVVRVVYNEYKRFGNNPIVVSPDFPELNEDSIGSIIDAWGIGKDIGAIKLSNWTHLPDSPWTKARKEGKTVIPDTYIKEYFSKYVNNPNPA